MRVEVVYALPHRQWIVPVELPEGALLEAALEHPAVSSRLAGHLPAELSVGIWGRAADRATPLREGDRVELYRPLTADPKDARRRRAARR